MLIVGLCEDLSPTSPAQARCSLLSPAVKPAPLSAHHGPELGNNSITRAVQDDPASKTAGRSQRRLRKWRGCVCRGDVFVRVCELCVCVCVCVFVCVWNDIVVLEVCVHLISCVCVCLRVCILVNFLCMHKNSIYRWQIYTCTCTEYIQIVLRAKSNWEKKL